MRYIFAIHIPIALLALWPLLGGPGLLLPLHLALLELVIDPACAIAFEQEPESPDVMQRPPRNTHRPLFGATDLAQAGILGIGLSAAIAAALLWATQLALWPQDSMAVRSLAVLTLVLGNGLLMLIGSGRRWQRWHPVAWGLITVTLGMLALLQHWPLLAVPLGLQPLPLQAWAVALLCSLAGVSLSSRIALRLTHHRP